MKNQHGLTLIELLVVVAITGVLLGIAAVALPNDHLAVNQAAQGFARQFPRARLEALKNDAFAGIAMSTTGDGSYYVCVDQNGDHLCEPSEAIQTVAMGQGSYAKVKLASTSSGFTQFMFDPRGIPMGTGGTVTFTNPDASFATTVTVTAAGKATFP